MLIRIKNAQKAGLETVQFPHSKFKYEIAKLLEREGWVEKAERKGKRIRKSIDIALIYKENKQPKISNVRLLSKPSRRLYTSYGKLSRSEHEGVIILSTPRGVMSSKRAVTEKVGGQLIAEIW